MPAYYNEHDPGWDIGRFVAYVVTNSINGKKYVGITTKGVANRWSEHVGESRRGKIRRALSAAIAKYGVDAFSVEAIACAFSWEGLCRLERLLIRQLNTHTPNGYNITTGGDGAFGLPTEIIAKMSANQRGRRHSEEAKRRIGEASSERPRSPQTRALIAAKHAGKVLTQEHRAKLSAAKLGKKLPQRSKEHCERISEGLRRAHARRKAVT